MTLVDLSSRVGVTVANLSILKNGHARAIRFNTLTAICDALGCTPATSSGSSAEPRTVRLGGTTGYWSTSADELDGRRHAPVLWACRRRVKVP